MEKVFIPSNTNNIINKGWQCPVCGRVLAPWVSECPCSQILYNRNITCQGENKNGSESIFESQKSHIPSIDSHFNDFDIKDNSFKVNFGPNDIYPKVDTGNIGENKVDIPSFMLDHNERVLNDIMHKCMNPFEGCKQTEGGGYIISEPLIEARPMDKKNNIVSLNKFKKDKGDKK